MILEKIVIQNFLSIRSITLDLQDRGLVLLKGINKDCEGIESNGSGKSSIIEAIVYSLYARTIRGLKGDEVVHKTPKKNMKIFLDILDDNGDKYRIARYRKHSTNKNRSLLYLNGKDITPKSEGDFNKRIAELLQADYLTFTSSLLYSAESFKFTSATDSEIKSTFDTMLGLDVLSKCLEITKNEIKKVDLELSTSETKIESLHDIIQSLHSKIEETKEDNKWYLKEQQEEEKSLIYKAQITTEQLNTKKDELQSLNEKLEELKTQKTTAQKQFDKKLSALDEINELKTEIQSLDLEIKDKQLCISHNNKTIRNNKISIESEETKINRLKNKILVIKDKQEQLENSIGEPCPTCGKPLDKTNIQSAIDEYTENIQELSQECEERNSKIETETNNIKELEQESNRYQTEIEQLQEDKDSFQTLIKKSDKLINDKNKAQQKLDKLQSQLHNTETSIKVKTYEVTQTQANIKEIEQQIEHNKNQKNPYESIILKYENELNSTKEQLKDLSSTIQPLLDQRDCLKFWQSAYSNQGIKSYILDDIVPFLNRRVNKYLSRLASGHIEVKFNTQSTLKTGELREKFSIDIINQDGGSTYTSNSGGEKRRIDLAINLALQDLVASRGDKKINIAIFDECFDALDSVGIENVIELLQDLVAEKSSIFVVSHNEHLQSYFSNSIIVQKKNGFSTLVNPEELQEDEIEA